MSGGTLPRDMWDQGFEEGERRIKRSFVGHASTGFIGGIDVMLGLALVVVLSGALLAVTTEELSHAIGALPFGVAFVFISIGKSELFTENFLVPVGAVLAGRGTRRELVNMWGMTLLFNLVGITLFAWILSIDGVLPESAYEAAGFLGDKFAERGVGEGLASAIAAGTALTLFTWMSLAVTSDGAKVALGLIIGYVLLLPVLNHAVVSFGEAMIAVFAGTTDAGFWDIASREAIAIVGNLIGGIGFVTTLRLVQVSGEPHDQDHANRQQRKRRIFLPWQRSDEDSDTSGFEVPEDVDTSRMRAQDPDERK